VKTVPVETTGGKTKKVALVKATFEYVIETIT